MLNPKLEESISPASLVDLGQIDRIEQTAFSTPWSAELIRAAIHNRQYEVRVLRTVEEPVTGFYIAHLTREKSNLDNLAIDERLRGNGFGTTLIRDWIARAGARKAALLTLQVNTQNVGAQRLYKVFGFKTIRPLPGYYPNGEDAYQMERPFIFRHPVAAP